MAAQKKKKQKTTYYQVTPQATTEQQLRIQKMRDELNAPDPNDPHVFTRYKKITYPFVVLFPPYAIRAAKEGCNCQGYMLWAFTDNVSPRNAFKNRYGLVEIDLEHNRDRHLKKSAFFYKQTIEQQSFDLEDDSAEYR